MAPGNNLGETVHFRTLWHCIIILGLKRRSDDAKIEKKMPSGQS